MALAPSPYLLYTRVMKQTGVTRSVRPRPLRALGRHASMLLYSILHCRVRLTIDDLKELPPVASPTPAIGVRGRAGIEATTGPAGPGHLERGRARAGRGDAGRAPQPRRTRADRHYTYTIASDGDLAGGVSAEACSLGGHLGLGKTDRFYDATTRSSSPDPTSVAFTEDVAGRYESYAGTCRTWRGPRARQPRAGRRRGEGVTDVPA